MIKGEFVEVGGMSFCLQKIVDFEVWLRQRYSKSLNDFMGLTRPQREEIFLRWKWGLTDPGSNMALEEGEKQTLYATKDMQCNNPNDPYQYYIGLKRNYDRYCFELKKRIDLCDELSDDEEVKKVEEIFNGRQV